MEFLLIGIVIGVTGRVIEVSTSKWASLLFMGSAWIGAGYLLAFGLNRALKAEEIDGKIYCGFYGFCYFFAVLGCGYLFPVFLGHGKKKPPKKELDL